jgi:hypothetical protein
MPQKLTLLGPAGRNTHKQALVRVKCSCGSPEFTCRADSFKQGRTSSCGCSRPGRRKAKLQPARMTTPAISSATTPAVAPTQAAPALTPEWYAQQITGKEAAAVAAEKRANDLEEKLATQDYTDLETHKQWNTEATTARKLRQEITRLKTAKDKAETGEKKDTRTQAEITRDRIAALRGQQR